MRIFLFIFFLFFSSLITAQKTVVPVIAIKNTNSKFQFVNKQTRIAVDNEVWDEAEPFINGFAKVYRNKKFSFVTGGGKLIAPVEFDAARNFSNKLCAVEKDGKWGFIDAAGKAAIPFKFDIVFDFTHPAVTVAFINKKWQLISNKGETIKQLDITSFYGFNSGTAKVTKENKEGTLYPSGKITWSPVATLVNKPIPWQPTPNNLSVPCPDNIGFEFGDFTNWDCFTGTVDDIAGVNIITVSPSAPVTNRHTIVTKATPSLLDQYGLFDTNPFDGSNFAVKLGNNATGGQAERVRYTIHVPINDSTFSIKYDYAVVFQDPGHNAYEQPRFVSKLVDSATGSPVGCASLEYISTANLPGFKTSTVDPSVKFKTWSSVFYSLRGYGGQTLYLEFTTADCTLGGHWGYAYVDVQSTCGSPVQVQYDCLAPNEMTLTAPPGFQGYNWWNFDYSTLLGTGQQLIMNPGLPIGSVVWLEILPFSSFGCPDTLKVTLNGQFDANFDINAPVGCAPQTYTFYSRNIPSTTTLWDFGDGNTASGDTVTHTYSIPGSYNVTMDVTMPGGCIGNAIKLITIYPTPSMAKPGDLIFCNNVPSGSINFTGSPTNVKFNWTNDNPFIGLPAAGTGNIPSFLTTNTGTTPIVANITVTPTFLTCSGPTQTFTITINPSPGLVQPANQALCKGSTTAAVIFVPTLSGTTFSWTNNNTSIGLAASGNGDIPAFTVTNTGSAPIIATITVTPSNGICPGIPKLFTITVNLPPDVNQPGNVTACNALPTGTINFTGSVMGTNYNWTNTNTSIGLAASGVGSIPSFNATNSGTAPISGFITVTPTIAGCPAGAAHFFTINVNPTPNVILPANQALCNGAATNAINFTGAVGGTGFSWTNDNPSIGLAANGSGNIPSFTAINTGNAPAIANINIYPVANGCFGSIQTFTITVNPIPDVVKPTDQILCNAAATNAINFTGAVSGTSFNWTNNNPAIGLAASGTGNIPSFTAVNTTTAPITATITITPSANSCPGASQSFTITVNPSPDVVQPSSQILCNAAATSAINFAGAVSGTSFNWINDNASIGLAASGTGDIPSFAAINTSNTPATATIMVTPSASGCAGLAKVFTIVVNPTPNLALPANQALCNGAATASINFTGSVSGTNFTWSNNNPSIGLAATGSGDIPSFIATNATNTPVLAIISASPFANGCQGPAQSFTITVFPTPDVVQPLNQVLCNATATNAVNFVGAVSGTILNWTNDNTSIGLAASGNGNIPSFTAINTTNAPVTATIIVTPTASGCPGVSKSFTIKVNPTPTIVQPASQVLCNGTTTNTVNFTGSVIGTSFNWTNDNAAIGLPASGNGNIPSFTATNNTNAPITATITITPLADNCAGIAQTFTIVVNPTPDVVQPSNQAVCNNEATNAINFTGAVSGTAYSWTNDNSSIGLAASGNGDIPSFTAINNSNTATIATITVAASANGCGNTARNFTIIVNPTPNVVQPPNQRICDRVATNAIIFSGTVAGTNFRWTNSDPSIGLSASGTGNISSFNASNPGPSPANATIIITPVAKGCTGSSKTVIVRVDPNPVIDLGNDLNLSTGTVINLNATVQNGPITNWAWVPATGLSCTNCATPALTVTSDVTFNVTVTNIFGCIARDAIAISTFCKNSQVFVPNAFTPDGDGLNDILMVRGKGIFVTSFRIFNRWGEMVFQKTNFNPNDKQYGWDGKVRGILATPDVFIFTAEVVCDNGIKYTYKGNTTLLK